LVVKVRVEGVVRNRPAYLVLGLNLEGKKEACRCLRDKTSRYALSG